MSCIIFVVKLHVLHLKLWFGACVSRRVSTSTPNTILSTKKLPWIYIMYKNGALQIHMCWKKVNPRVYFRGLLPEILSWLEEICLQIKSNHWWQFNAALRNYLKGKTLKTSLFVEVSFDLWTRSPADYERPNWGKLIFIDLSFSLNKTPKWVWVCGVLSFAVYLEKCGWGFLRADLIV